jgi:hypothetical protein
MITNLRKEKRRKDQIYNIPLQLKNLKFEQQIWVLGKTWSVN